MELETITPLLLTYNEEANLDRVLQRLRWARQIVVIDSFSTDQTLAILDRYPAVTLYQRPFDSFAEQCNFGLGKVTTDWTLSLDADYVLSPALVEELGQLDARADVSGYRVGFRYCVFGQPLRGTLLPDRTVLYRTSAARYTNDGHAHRVAIAGPVGQLQQPIFHDDRKSLRRWLWAQDRYMPLEVEKLMSTPAADLSWSDRLRLTKVLSPPLILGYCLIVKGGILDGWRGWYYTLQRVLAEVLLILHLLEHEQRQRETTG
jgi:glycosyltransferase involved in cell wall biosynthesis